MTNNTLSNRVRLALAGGAAAVALIVTGVAPFGATLAYAAGDDYTKWEDCDWDGYDDHTGVKVPWPGFDGTKGDTPAGPSEDSQTGQGQTKPKPTPKPSASVTPTASATPKPSTSAKPTTKATSKSTSTAKASTKSVATATASASDDASSQATATPIATGEPTPTQTAEVSAVAAPSSSDPSAAAAYSASTESGNPELVIGLSVLGGLAAVAGVGVATTAVVRRRASA